MINSLLTRKSLRVLTFVLVVPITCLQGQVDKGQERADLRRPVRMRPKLEARVEEGLVDGFFYRNLYLENNGISFTMPALEGWNLEENLGNESISLMRNYGKKGKERLSISLYGKGELLGDFYEATLRGYADLVKKEFPGKQVEVLNEEEGFKVKHTFFILGKTYRLVEFKVGSGKDTEYFKDYIVLLYHKKYPLVVLRHQGPKKYLEKSKQRVEDSLRFSEIVKEPSTKG